MPNITLASIFAVYIIGAGIILWAAFNTRPADENRPVSFHLTYAILPILVFLLSVAITIFFYPNLPAEVAYSFKTGAVPGYISKGITLLLMLLSQLLFALPLVGITWGVIRLSRTNPSVTLERTLLMIGNLAALPQLIICFALADIFSYNSYGSHLMPLWLFAIIIMVTGAGLVGLLFAGAIRHRKSLDSHLKDKE